MAKTEDMIELLSLKCDRLIENGQEEEAIKCYDSMMNTFSSAYDIANYRKGLVYFRLGEYEKAKECFEKSLKVAPDDSSTIIRIAFCECRLGEKGNARTLIQKAVDLAPNSIYILFFAAIISFELGDEGQSDEYIAKAMDVSSLGTMELWEEWANIILVDPDENPEDKVRLRVIVSENKALAEKFRMQERIEREKKKKK